jgi:two-component system response regulator
MNHVYLVAEDHKDSQILLEKAFLKAGLDYPLRFTDDGVETLDYLYGRGQFRDRSVYPFPAILLLDFDMPKLNGFEVLKAIRSEPDLKKLAVVMFSSSVDEPQIEKAYELGANSYIEKPVAFGELVHTVVCINQYWFGCNHFPHSAKGIVRPDKRHRVLPLGDANK